MGNSRTPGARAAFYYRGMPQRRPPRLSVILAIAAAVALGGWFFRYHIRDDLFARNFGVVEAGQIYRSGRQTPAMMEQIVRANGIRTIIDLGAFAPGSREEAIADQTAKALGVTRFRFGLYGDGTGDPNEYVAALRLMTDPALRPVLVHCAAGAQRTSGCVVLYRHHVQGQPLAGAFPESFAFKHDPGRNPNLAPYLNRWSTEIGAALKDGTRIDYREPGSPHARSE